MQDALLAADSLCGRRVALVGRLAGATHREATEMLRRRGAAVHDAPGVDCQLIVLGEYGANRAALETRFETEFAALLATGAMELIDETELWRRLGLVDGLPQVQRHYTPRMLAEIVAVPASRVRSWLHHGLLTATREVYRLAYFDFSALVAARRIKELTAAGLSAKTICAGLERISRWLPQVTHPLAELSLVANEGRLALRWQGGLVDPDGQRRLEFDVERTIRIAAETLEPPEPQTVEEWLDWSAELDEQGDLSGAVEACRAASVVGPPVAEVSFQLAELLYRQGELSAARERYYMAVELDPNFVEARANLGCLLVELGQSELAVAAFEGALGYHADYPDVHYHVARALDDLGRHAEAEEHWREFLELAPNSPWAEIAERRLQLAPLT